MPGNRRRRKGVNRSRNSAHNRNGNRASVRDTGTFKPVKGSAMSSESHPSSSLTVIDEMRIPGYPPSQVRRLRYATTFSISSSTGVPAGYVFRANDLFDPDFTSTGHQPDPFDSLMIPYNHFCVMKSKITATFRNPSASCMVAIRQDGDNVIITNPDQLLEGGGIVTDTLEVKGTYGSEKTLSLGLNLAKLWGVTSRQHLADPTYRGSASASPTEVTYFHLMAWDPAGTTTSLTGVVVMDFLAAFMEPRTPTLSKELELAWSLWKSYMKRGFTHTRDMAKALDLYKTEPLFRSGPRSIGETPLTGSPFVTVSSTKSGVLSVPELSDNNNMNDGATAPESKTEPPVPQTSLGFLNNLLR